MTCGLCSITSRAVIESGLIVWFTPQYCPVQRIAVHHTGVQLKGFITGIHRANSGIKQWTLFQQGVPPGNDIQYDRLQASVGRFQRYPTAPVYNATLALAQLRTGEMLLRRRELQ